MLFATGAQAQVTFGIGPRLGANLSNASFKESFAPDVPTHDVPTKYRTGLEVGLVAAIGYGHFVLQPAVLYSQKGFTIQNTHQELSPNGYTTLEMSHDDTFRFNYLNLPLNLTYAQNADGQGFQVFAGPYLSVLLGGDFETHIKNREGAGAGAFFRSEEVWEKGRVVPSAARLTSKDYPLGYGKWRSQRLDAGVQFGLGYRLGGTLLQVGYSLGLHNEGVDGIVHYSSPNRMYSPEGAHYYNRAFQVSLAYLFGLKGE